jgi:outer membrane protein TolC
MNPKIETRTRRSLLTASLRVTFLLIIFGARIQAGMAQNITSSGEKLTLAGAVDLALKQNLDIQIADIETATRQQGRAIARSELLPHASFEADDSVRVRAEIYARWLLG